MDSCSLDAVFHYVAHDHRNYELQVSELVVCPLENMVESVEAASVIDWKSVESECLLVSVMWFVHAASMKSKASWLTLRHLQ